ncbi:MAG: hypothetical protein GY771_10060, partial [bacterium]|nr:hypothetical protein [bacterium]
MKSYGESMYMYYSFVPYRQLFDYLLSYSPLFLLILGGIIVNFKKWIRNGSTFEKGLLISVGLFIFYYAFFVLQVMFYNYRFYFPTLPAVVFLGCQGAVSIYNELPERLKEGISEIPSSVRTAVFIFVLGFLVFPLITATNHFVTRALIGETLQFNLDADSKRIWNWELYWLQLTAFSQLPDDLVIATTEVGLPAVMNPGKEIVDLAGLHETKFAQSGFSADYLFKEYNPDLIYLPHPHYINMIEEIKNHEYFQANYNLYTAEDFGVLMDVGIRRDSKYYDEMTRLLEKAPIVEEPASGGERPAGHRPL